VNELEMRKPVLKSKGEGRKDKIERVRESGKSPKFPGS
jgi:hypothetical protein